MVSTCEMRACQFNQIDGDCVHTPDWHHCTANCATTASPTAEPTKSPTEEPTKSPTDEPTVSPTDEPTDEPTPSPSIGQCPEHGIASIGDRCNHFEAQCKYDFVECCGNRYANTICHCEHGTFQCMQTDRCMQPCPVTPHPTVDGGGGWGSPKTPQPTSGKPQRTPRPIVTRTPRPTANQVKTPRPSKAKPSKTPRPIQVKTPRPIKEKPSRTPRPVQEKTPRPTKAKAPRPSKPQKTPRPTATYLATTPEPTEDQSGWGAAMPSKDILENEHAEMIAVDINGSTDSFSGYSSQTEIVGLFSIVTVFAICGYSMMC